MIVKLNVCNLEFARMKLKNQKRFLFSLINEVLIMALNDTFKIHPKNKISLKADLSSLLTNKDYWAEECKENPSKIECLFYCD